MTDVATVEHEGFTVTSNSETEEQIRESLGTSKDQETSKAAATLGKKGGEAAAKAKEASKDERRPVKPIKDAKPKEAKPVEKVEPAEQEEAEAPAPEKAAAPEKPAEPEPSKKGNPRHDPTARVAEATRQAAEYRRRAEAAETRLRELESRAPEPTRPAPAAEAVEEDDAPREENYKTYGEYVKATIEHKAERIAEKVATERINATLTQIQQSQRAAQVEQAHNARVAEWSKALEAAQESDPEFQDKLSEEVYSLPWAGPKQGEKYTTQHVIAQVILSRPESSAQVMLHLSEQPDVLQRLSTLHPTEVSWELGRIAGSMGAATAGKPASRVEPRVSRASAPVPPVTGSPLTADEDITQIESFDRFAAARMAQQKARAQR